MRNKQKDRVVLTTRLVTPGNKAAAVVGGFNVIVFSTIAFLAHREKVQKKRNNQLAVVVDSSESVLPASADAKTTQAQGHDEKRLQDDVREVKSF